MARNFCGDIRGDERATCVGGVGVLLFYVESGKGKRDTAVPRSVELAFIALSNDEV